MLNLREVGLLLREWRGKELGEERREGEKSEGEGRREEEIPKGWFTLPC